MIVLEGLSVATAQDCLSQIQCHKIVENANAMLGFTNSKKLHVHCHSYPNNSLYPKKLAVLKESKLFHHSKMLKSVFLKKILDKIIGPRKLQKLPLLINAN